MKSQVILYSDLHTGQLAWHWHSFPWDSLHFPGQVTAPSAMRVAPLGQISVPSGLTSRKCKQISLTWCLFATSFIRFPRGKNSCCIHGPGRKSWLQLMSKVQHQGHLKSHPWLPAAKIHSQNSSDRKLSILHGIQEQPSSPPPHELTHSLDSSAWCRRANFWVSQFHPLRTHTAGTQWRSVSLPFHTTPCQNSGSCYPHPLSSVQESALSQLATPRTI